jgi:hypothetical protein
MINQPPTLQMKSFGKLIALPGILISAGVRLNQADAFLAKLERTVSPTEMLPKTGVAIRPRSLLRMPSEMLGMVN